MSHINEINSLKQMIAASVSPYHCIQAAKNRLENAGFEEVSLTGNWNLKKGGSYFVNVYDSTLIGFTIGENLSDSPDIRIAASHTDWPCLKVKPSPEVVSNRYGKLNVEVYGGPILSTWMDRPLSIAGKVCVEGIDAFHPETIFINHEKPLLTIPNLAIHMNREVNNGTAFNPQTDMLPLLAVITEELDKDHFFLNLLAKEAGTAPEKILDYEIMLYNTEEGATLGLDDALFSSPRLDNITSVEACLSGIMANRRSNGINVIALYDNEEVGSATKQGAASGLMERILEKLFASLGYDRTVLINSLFGGFLLSIDVAHAVHPNHPEKCDIKNQITMGDGVAIKLASSQAYATDASHASIIEGLCRSHSIAYKKFSNRSDIRGGSTLGSISSGNLNIPTVDIGVPMLAMHSSRELMACSDQKALVDLVKAYFA